MAKMKGFQYIPHSNTKIIKPGKEGERKGINE